GDWENFRLHQFGWRPSLRLCRLLQQVSDVLRGAVPLAESASLIAAGSPLEQETWLAICFRAMAFSDFIRLLASLPDGRHAAPQTLADRLRCCLHLTDTAPTTLGTDPAPAAPTAGENDDFWAHEVLARLARWSAKREWS